MQLLYPASASYCYQTDVPLSYLYRQVVYVKGEQELL